MHRYRIEAHIILRVTLTILWILCAVPRDGLGQSIGKDFKKLERLPLLAQTSHSAAYIVREGRDLIADGKWGPALQKFNEVVSRFPDGQYTDAALYWRAFILKKQDKYQEADKSLQLLMQKFPKSQWIQDARTMLVEIGPRLGRGEMVAEEARNSENDEVKVVALQSLFQANPERAMTFVYDILQPGSTSSYRVREGAITLLGRYGDHANGERATQLLLDLVQGEQDVKLRKKTIYQLGRGEWSENKFRFDGDEQILQVLSELAMQADEREIAEAAVSAVSHIANHRDDARIKPLLIDMGKNAPVREVRKIAISRVGEMAEDEGDAILPDMVGLYDANQDIDLKKRIISIISEMKSEQAQTKVIEFARSADHPDLRHRAIHVIGDRGSIVGIEALADIYKQETDHNLKSRIMDAFRNSDHKIALQKLMEIARSDDDLKMRMKAVSVLGHSKDPEAQQFLEDLLK